MSVKRIIVAMLCLFFIPLTSFTVADEKKVMEKKFTFTYEVTFNSLTLKEGAEKEKEFRERYRDSACRVDVKVKEPDGIIYSRANNPNQQLHIETSGNVGIGTSQPSGTLSVNK